MRLYLVVYLRPAQTSQRRTSLNLTSWTYLGFSPSSLNWRSTKLELSILCTDGHVDRTQWELTPFHRDPYHGIYSQSRFSLSASSNTMLTLLGSLGSKEVPSPTALCVQATRPVEEPAPDEHFDRPTTDLAIRLAKQVGDRYLLGKGVCRT